MNLDNYLVGILKKLNLSPSYTNEYTELYSNIKHKDLVIIFPYLHAEYVNCFESMNTRLPTGASEAHYWAQNSRQLLQAINITLDMEIKLNTTKYQFIIDDYYNKIIVQCKNFLTACGGSQIPAYMDSIEVFYKIPIFKTDITIEIDNTNKLNYENLKLIGEGSYAQIYKYHDSFYNKDFVLKCAKKNLSEKELQRFENEYYQMSSLHSPYIVEVYTYNANKHRYIMEYMDYTLEKYIDEYNSQLSISDRCNIIFQLIKVFKYLHSKNILHRDISFNNVLINKYDDVLVCKISDFGLIKIANSQLTSENSEIKGSLNDPSLKIKGFSRYDLYDEIYALTLLFTFILSGKHNFDKISNKVILQFMNKGTNANRNERFNSLDELLNAIKDIKSKLEIV